jgi:inner membrane transporter RhtA
VSDGRRAILLPLLALVGAMAAFQSGAAVAKSLFPAVGAEGAAALRLSLGAIMLLALVRPWRAWPKRAPVWLLAGLGASMGLTILFFYLALSRLPLGVAISLQFLGPLTVAVVGSRRTSDFLWAALAAGGVWLLVGLGARHSRPDLIGVGFALAAAAGWAAYIVIGRITSAAFGHTTAAFAVAIAAVVVFPVGLAHAGHALFSLRLLPLALLVGALSAAIPFSLEL